MIYFYANYTNRTSSESVNGSGVGCNISFDGSYSGMEFNSSSGVYYYNRSFEDLRVRSYTEEFNVSCFGNGLSYEELNYSSSLDVELNATLLSLNSEHNLTALKESSLVLADWNNDGWIDLVYTGHNNDIDTRPLYIYSNNYSNFALNESLSGVYHSTLSLIDYDKDDNLEIIIFGYSNLHMNDTKIYRK